MKKILTFLIFGIVIGMSDCNKPVPESTDTELQQRAPSLVGTWADAHNILVPPCVGNDIIENLSMTFFTDTNLNPAGFNATGAPLIFESESNASWEFNNGDKDNILLNDVSPVSSFNIVNFEPMNTSMTINFYHPGLNYYAHKGRDYVVTLINHSFI